MPDRTLEDGLGTVEAAPGSSEDGSDFLDAFALSSNVHDLLADADGEQLGIHLAEGQVVGQGRDRFTLQVKLDR